MGKLIEALLVSTAAGCLAVAVGCATTGKEMVSGKNSYAQGVEDGRKAYIDEFGPMLRACASVDAVEALNKENKELRAMVQKGKDFATGCLAGYKKVRAEADTCKGALEIAENQK